MLRNNLLPLLLACMSISLNAETCDSLKTIQKGNKTLVEYKVDKGNTLYYLSKRFNTSVQDIKSTNGIEVLQVNSIVYIPIKPSRRIYDIPAGVGKKSHIVQANETLYGISKLTNVSVPNLQKYNGLTSNEISVGQTLWLVPQKGNNLTGAPKTVSSPTNTSIAPTQSTQNVHIVQKGETLYSISRSSGVDLKKLKSLNHLSSNEVSIGQALKLPVSARKIIQIKCKMLTSNQSELDPLYTEVICPKGNPGEVVQLVHPQTKQVVYARIVKLSKDDQVYATKKTFDALGIEEFSTPILLNYCQ